MATTRESVIDGLRWCAEILRIFTRRAAITAVFVAIFAAVVLYTTRERISDCSDVTAEQEEVLLGLRSVVAGRSFTAADDPGCVDGTYRAPLTGLPDTIEPATDLLLADGWQMETEFLPFFDQLWRRCFSLDRPGWERVQVNLDAIRAGDLIAASVIAPENGDACEAERREFSEIYPPADS
ncbi:MAG: hypothetical protein AAF480_19145 [Actinomycetota bacterium]